MLFARYDIPLSGTRWERFKRSISFVPSVGDRRYPVKNTVRLISQGRRCVRFSVRIAVLWSLIMRWTSLASITGSRVVNVSATWMTSALMGFLGVGAVGEMAESLKSWRYSLNACVLSFVSAKSGSEDWGLTALADLHIS